VIGLFRRENLLGIGERQPYGNLSQLT